MPCGTDTVITGAFILGTAFARSPSSSAPSSPRCGSLVSPPISSVIFKGEAHFGGRYDTPFDDLVTLAICSPQELNGVSESFYRGRSAVAEKLSDSLRFGVNAERSHGGIRSKADLGGCPLPILAWSCPKCGRKINKRAGKPPKCPKCGPLTTPRR